MGTHPIFESDFDCLTEIAFNAKMDADFCARTRRREIEASLTRQQSTLEAIEAAMARADEMTVNMSSILENFGSRLENLEAAVIPVHRQTKDLQRLQENIDKVMNSIDTVVAYHNVVKKNQTVISQMPQGNLEAFCAAMAELQTAVDFFESNSPDSPELKKVSALFQVGKGKMIEYYDALLRRHSHADTPKTVLISIKAKVPLDLEFPKLALDELEKMSSWIFHHLSDKKSFTDVYCQVREECMRQTIHGMREHVRQEGGITPRKNFTIRRSIASRKSEKRKSIRNRSSVHRMTRFQSSRSFMSPDKGSSQLPKQSTVEYEVADGDIIPFTRTVESFVKLAQREVALMKLVLPEDLHSKVLENIVSDTVNEISTESGFFVQLLRDNTNRNRITKSSG